MSPNRVKQHMEVIGADGVHVGTVDRVANGKIRLTKARQRSRVSQRPPSFYRFGAGRGSRRTEGAAVGECGGGSYL